MSDKKLTSIRMDQATHERLKALAKAANMSLGDFLETVSLDQNKQQQVLLLNLFEDLVRARAGLQKCGLSNLAASEAIIKTFREFQKTEK